MSKGAKIGLGFLLLIVVLAGVLFGYSIYQHKTLQASKEELMYMNTVNRCSSLNAMETILDSNSMLLMGSSELYGIDTVAYPSTLFNNGNSDYNVIMMGRDSMQSLHHAISIGALGKNIKNKKVVLIISPQWFTEEHVSPTMYAARFSESLFAGMVKNASLSYSLKRRLADRAEEYLMEGDPSEYQRVLLYDKIYIEKSASIPEILQCKVWDAFSEKRQNRMLINDLNNNEYKQNEDRVVAADIDYRVLLEEAEKIGSESCTNNEFGMYDEYYTEHIFPYIDGVKDRAINSSYSVSPEYDDFELFLDVCDELGINPMVVNIPVNGRWYDYQGFPKMERDKYYQRIRDICSERPVSILDFSDKEYEPFFLKDAMHLGWKGWVYLNEAVYRYYLEDEDVVAYPFHVNAFALKNEENNYVITFGNHISDVVSATIDGTQDILTINEEGYLEGTAKSIDDTITIQGNSLYGSKVTARVDVTKAEQFMTPDMVSKTDGVYLTTKKTGYEISTNVENNTFNMLAVQLYSEDGDEYLGDILGTGEGHIYYRYRLESEPGNYTIKFKGNSTKADEEIRFNVFIDDGYVCDFDFNVDDFQPGEIVVSDISIITGYPTGAGLVNKKQWADASDITWSTGVTETQTCIYTFKSRSEDNVFNSVVLQVYDSKKGDHIEDIYYSGAETVRGEYVNQLQEGNFVFRLRCNSNMEDEMISEEVFLRHGDVCHYEYDVSKFSSSEVTVKNVFFWHSAK